MDATARFARACGAQTDVDLRIERDDGLPLAEGQLDLPVALIGSDPDGEITLMDPAVRSRHACLQVVGGRVLVAALGSEAQVLGPASGKGFAWLTTTASVKIGPFQIHLRQPVSVSPMPLDRGFDPVQAAPNVVATLPKTVIRFLNGRSPTSEWTVNRLLTFVGRGPDCKISLAADDIAEHHCYFLLTPDGLWVVDLLAPGGIRVNDTPVRFARVGPDDVVSVGRFQFGCDYPAGSANPPNAMAKNVIAPAAPPPPSAPAVEPSGGTTIIRGRVVEQFRQSILDMLDSLGDLPRETVNIVYKELDRVGRLSTEISDLETRTDPNHVIDGGDETGKKIATLRAERKAIWQAIFALLANVDHQTVGDRKPEER